jgi:hypothetical protein
VQKYCFFSFQPNFIEKKCLFQEKNANFAADLPLKPTKKMKKTTILCSLTLSAMMLTGCGTQNSALTQIGTQVLNDVLLGTNTAGTAGTTTVENAGGALGNILGSVLGVSTRPTKQQLIGTWTYSQPGCAFTSDQLLAQAGGEVVATQIKTKLAPTFQSIGVKPSNTKVTFNQDGTFSAQFAGTGMNGNYTYDEATQKVTMQGMLLNINCYAKRNADGIALLFESSKLLSLLQTMSALSGNGTVQTVGDISKSYNGLRLGFDFRK